jgi:hypothetical protein
MVVAVKRALELVREGRVYDLGRVLDEHALGLPGPPLPPAARAQRYGHAVAEVAGPSGFAVHGIETAPQLVVPA